ncbi:hypothetical protein [Halorussus litoreus]|uniref:hypothetical protein n=1 Tax=Halorussus litoreus TaxID=1710536 RepID=UPI0013007AF9|nr:hypothetical protein [Halorussus litoreus]
MELIETLQNSANETDEERADRLAVLADEQDVSPETLYHIEEELDTLFTDGATETDLDPDAWIADLAETFAPLLLGQDVEGEQLLAMFGGYETLQPLAVQGLVGASAETAAAAKYLYDLYRAEGYYEDAGIDPEANWAESDEPIQVVGEHVRNSAILDSDDLPGTGGA